jgi:FixJ family two-component response regulator
VNKRDTRVVSIVDDDHSMRRSVRNLLLSLGFRVETFESAEAFLRSDHRDDTGCLILDLRMPDMNGEDLLAHLAAVGTPVPTVILTAHGDEQTRRRLLRLGIVAFLGKPFQSDVLLDAVKTAMQTP